MQTLGRDLLYAFRTLRKTPGYVAVAVLTLAIGVGANTTVFALVNMLLFRPPAVEKPSELLQVYETSQGDSLGDFSKFSPFCYPDYRDMRDRNQVFSSVALYNAYEIRFGEEGPGEQLLGQYATGNYFATLGVQPRLGRLFTADDDRFGATPVAVLSERLWRNKFQSDPAIAGKVVTLNRTKYTVAGVAPEKFQGTMVGLVPDVWVPIHSVAETGNSRWLVESREGRSMWVIGRLKPGVTREQAFANLQAIAAQWRSEHPETNKGRDVSLTEVSMLPGGVRANVQAFAAVLLVLVSLLLLIACANMANLALARADARRREVGVRLALGAGRWTILRQLLVESLLVALAGGGAGLAAAAWLGGFLSGRLEFAPIPIYVDLSADYRVAAFAFGAAIMASLIFGLGPAWRASRLDLVPALKEGTAGAGLSRSRTRRFLVTAQVAVSTVLLVCAGLCLRSLAQTNAIDPGFDPARGLTAAISMPEREFPAADRENFFRVGLERIRALPGVEAAGLTEVLPLQFEIRTSGIAIEGQSEVDDDHLPEIDTSAIGPGYFAALGVPVLAGREFTDQDNAQAPRVAIVNQSFARKYFGNQSPVGKRLWGLSKRKRYEMQIVGVVKDGKYRTLGEDPRPYYWEAGQQSRGGFERVTLVVRTTGDPGALGAVLRRELEAVNRNVPVDIRTLAERMQTALLPAKALAAVLGTFGALGLVLAAVGIYGVITYLTGRRTHEIGVRIALGAKPADILRLVLGQGAWLAGLGLGVGVIGAALAARLISSMLYGVSPTDPLTFAAVAGVLAAVALAANWIPARRAAKVDPIRALRQD